MKYKVGDKVRVRKDLEIGKYYGTDAFIPDMKKYAGKTMIVDAIISADRYSLKDAGHWNWTDEMLEDAVKVVEYAKDHGLAVELAAEDSTRTDVEYLRKIFKATIDAGADRICPCDTLGILTPLKSFNFYRKFTDLGVPVSAHCHNDFGLAVANTLSALKGGATEIHTTINGIGERAGNTSFEECVVSIDRLLPEFSTDIKI